MPYGPIAAKVNNKVEGMNFRLYHNKDVEFLDMTSGSGSRCYTRTLFFVLSKAVHDLYPGSRVVIDIPVSNGYYVDLYIGRAVSLEDTERIRKRMQEIIDAKMPVRRFEVPTDEAVKMFEDKGDCAKAKLLRSSGRSTLSITRSTIMWTTTTARCSPTRRSSTSSGWKIFRRTAAAHSRPENPGVLPEMTHQDKMFEIFKEHHRWQDIMGVRTIGDFNEMVSEGKATELINVSEALQEKKIARIADEIANRKGVKLILLAGPSSSGKTTTCKRLSIQLLANGIKPLQISLDDYFVDRHLTPKDENGEYDYESVYALNLKLINDQFNALFRGEEVELPKYNFQTGTSEKSGKKLKMADDNVLVVEGIHALNPVLTEQIPEGQKFRVYVSALTTILLDDHNYIPTTDNRLLRRIIRDYKYRGVNAQDSIHRWPSVRAGENKWIFPYQENADAVFNSAMLFELAVIKQQAEPLLEQVPENCEEYSEAYRLRKFLKYLRPIPNRDIPPTSLLREFLGGSSFKY